MTYNVDVLYSSQVRRKARKDLTNKIKGAMKIVIVVRQVPKGNVLPRFIGRKEKTERGFCCYIYPPSKKVPAKIIRELIEVKLSSIHWIEFRS